MPLRDTRDAVKEVNLFVCFQAASQTHAEPRDDHKEPGEGQVVVLHPGAYQTAPAQESVES